MNEGQPRGLHHGRRHEAREQADYRYAVQPVDQASCNHRGVLIDVLAGTRAAYRRCKRKAVIDAEHACRSHSPQRLELSRATVITRRARRRRPGSGADAPHRSIALNIRSPAAACCAIELCDRNLASPHQRHVAAAFRTTPRTAAVRGGCADLRFATPIVSIHSWRTPKLPPRSFHALTTRRVSPPRNAIRAFAAPAQNCDFKPTGSHAAARRGRSAAERNARNNLLQIPMRNRRARRCANAPGPASWLSRRTPAATPKHTPQDSHATETRLAAPP